MLHLIKQATLHPALLFVAGNTALAVGHAEVIAISLNVLLALAVLATRWLEVHKKRPFGVPFAILAIVNFVTAGSVIYTNMINPEQVQLLDHLVALAYVTWGVGHLLAGRHERRSSTAKRISENPQVFYGIGDMTAVNASGSINFFSFPFMIIGFIKSVFIGRGLITKSKSLQFFQNELPASRIYSIGFFVGAITSFAVPYFVVAQLFWGLAYFQFKKDT